MPILSKIITRPPGQIWMLTTGETREAFFSSAEISDVLVPFEQYVSSLPGLQETQINFTASNVYKVDYVFDNIQNLNAAKLAMEDSANPVVSAKNELVRGKLRDAGISYTIEWDITE